MSWDVYLRGKCCAVCEQHTGGRNLGDYTWNTGPMFFKASGGTNLSNLNGLEARDAARVLDAALVEMTAHADEYRAMNPANGWGDFDTFREWLQKILEACREMPDAVLCVR